MQPAAAGAGVLSSPLLTAARTAAMLAQGLAIPPRAARMCLPEIPCVDDGGERKYRPADALAAINS
jgi:hypothetical protein